MTITDINAAAYQTGLPGSLAQPSMEASCGYDDRHPEHDDTVREADIHPPANEMLSPGPAEDPRCGSPEPPQIRANPKEMERARIEFAPIPASQLGRGEQVDWIWHGYVARGHITLLIGLWKAGKSTLLAHVLKALEAGGDIAGEIKPSRAVVITEESAGHWARRRDDLGLGDCVHFQVRPFRGRPQLSAWRQYVQQVAEAVERGDYDLVVIDTWQVVSPCRDENDAASMTAALMPLHEITEAGAGVLLVHHPRKGDASEGQASRGSGALPGFVDTIVELRRFNAEQADDRRRKLRGLSRFEETPTEVVVELREDGFHLVGTSGDADRAQRWEVMRQILSDGIARTPQEVIEAWPSGKIVPPGMRTTRYDLNAGSEKQLWCQSGAGTKGDPYRYQFVSCTLHFLGAGNESNDVSDEAVRVSASSVEVGLLPETAG